MADLPKGIIIAAPKSGSGKTLITLSLLRALKNKSIKVASAKIGPDYIDPAFHTAASGAQCLNIDPWAMKEASQNAVMNQLQMTSPELVLTEGVMGLFDGAKDGTGSTADFAAMSGWPVVLIVDVKGQAASAAAIVKGFSCFRNDVKIGAVIFNNVASSNHRDMISQAMNEYLSEIPVLGYLPRLNGLALPERHLGLVQAGEHEDLELFLETSAQWVSENCNLDELLQLSNSFRFDNKTSNNSFFKPIGQRIAIAKDIAFSFSYAGLLTHWRQCGAEISSFSPLANEVPSDDADAIYLPGGYPELHAGKLAANELFLSGMRKAAERGCFIFGECGGYMTLGRQLIDENGHAHKMVGLLPVETNFQKRKLHLGYRKAVLQGESRLGLKGESYRAHEFHYASTDYIDRNAQPLFKINDATDKDLGNAGLMVNNVAGSFIHLIDKV